ncbi:hypothetical protein ACFPOB_17875 [Bosea eneae]|uniref:DUF2474 domain-containing protein n=1 Tax=Bosea eneae TaxID=151454 RepID=A0ABW0IVZ5_9HYPH
MREPEEQDWNAEARQRSVRFLLWLVIAGLSGVLVGLLVKRWLIM